MFSNIRNMTKERVEAEYKKVEDIEKRVNAGKCKDFEIARFLRSYPATLYLDGRKGVRSIQGVDFIEKTRNGYRIQYHDEECEERIVDIVWKT